MRKGKIDVIDATGFAVVESGGQHPFTVSCTLLCESHGAISSRALPSGLRWVRCGALIGRSLACEEDSAIPEVVEIS